MTRTLHRCVQAAKQQRKQERGDRKSASAAPDNPALEKKKEVVRQQQPCCQATLRQDQSATQAQQRTPPSVATSTYQLLPKGFQTTRRQWRTYNVSILCRQNTGVCTEPSTCHQTLETVQHSSSIEPDQYKSSTVSEKSVCNLPAWSILEGSGSTYHAYTHLGRMPLLDASHLKQDAQWRQPQPQAQPPPPSSLKTAPNGVGCHSMALVSSQ